LSESLNLSTARINIEGRQIVFESLKEARKRHLLGCAFNAY